MVKSTNGALGVEVVREGQFIVFIGKFKKGITSKMKVRVNDVMKIFGDTGTTTVHDSNGQYVGLIGYEPQGTSFIFPPNQGHDMIFVESDEIKAAVEDAIN